MAKARSIPLAPASPRVVVVVNDIHSGSTAGLLPPDFETLEGNRIAQNRFQAWLWACWSHATTEWLPKVVGCDPWALVLNGDLVEGCHHGTKEVISPDEGDHKAAAVQILKPLADSAARVFVTEGTECHSKTAEHSIAKELGAVPDPDTGKHAWPRLELTVAGTLCAFDHHIPATIRSYLEASQYSMALGVERIEAQRNGVACPKVIVRAHRHRFGFFGDGDGMVVVGAPWQGLTRHGRKVVTGARCNPGIFALDWRTKADGDVPDIRYQTYRAPAAKGVAV
jgi:hypothetical protein